MTIGLCISLYLWAVMLRVGRSIAGASPPPPVGASVGVRER